jgi:plastocyanin
VPTVNITVTSTAFVEGASIPLANRAISAGGSNTSPQLSWSATGSTGDIAYYEIFAFESIPPDVLWDVTGIPAGTTSIITNGTWPEGTTINTIDDLQRSNGYYGPRPTANTGLHTYYYNVAAFHSNGSFLGYGELSGIINSNTPQTYNLTVTAPSTAAYVISGSHRLGDISSSNNPSIVINVGDTVNFNLNSSGGSLNTHPFNIKTAATTGTGNRVTTGTTSGQGRTTVGTTSWNTSTGTTVSPGTYYYICGNHSSMQGTITVREATA